MNGARPRQRMLVDLAEIPARDFFEILQSWAEHYHYGRPPEGSMVPNAISNQQAVVEYKGALYRILIAIAPMPT